MTLEDVRLITKDLKNGKAAGGDIALKLLKECEFANEKLTNCIVKIILDSVKKANITPVSKKNDSLDKENYKPVCILPLLSKVYERAVFNQLSEYMQNFLNKILCGFCKAHSTQHASFKMLQAWPRECNKSANVVTILIDPLLTFTDSKIRGVCLGKVSLNILFDYLNGCKQRTKTGCLFSSLYEIITGTPQGLILEPLLFSILINDLLYQIRNM